ncbi:hypothetical protein BDB01DRAFT_764259 [Pilobolus umbonatus]|nr:hypothetical protein BDB01DRAFT_764259 [Pilobolus umbonatus]
MPSLIKYHHFKEKNFQGLVYCDYCEKLLWGGRHGVECTECNYHCHIQCSDMVIQCRPPRRISPDYLSVTDSEAESIKYHSPRQSIDLRYSTDDSLSTSSSHRRRTMSSDLKESDHSSSEQMILAHSHRTKSNLNKSYRKSLQKQLQSKLYIPEQQNLMSPNATAKAFTRLVARSKAFFYLTQKMDDIYNWNTPMSIVICIQWITLCLFPSSVLLIPPLLIVLLYTQTGIQPKSASEILVPRYDESTPEYYQNLESMQYAFTFLIRLYDNLAYHLHHVPLNALAYKALFVFSLCISCTFLYMGRYLVMGIGLMVLLNKTWVGTALESVGKYVMHGVQTMMAMKNIRQERGPMDVSVYENQRWWAGHGFTSQLLRSERSGWSNITGLEPLPSYEDMPCPVHYKWADNEWHLDRTGPWIDDVLGIGNENNKCMFICLFTLFLF